ncbi:hypothetical protein C8F04DRAFT_1267651 [Mycena alexandri]|uniref:Uncharacterized protein n=1 Tax=Mycena alexandri TaxID=1745969 RepID=A0AAD6WTT6_9AGAR|nr:hypothetical protein C8F04DRAFT_1267651 [Mycena alexandri]
MDTDSPTSALRALNSFLFRPIRGAIVVLVNNLNFYSRLYLFTHCLHRPGPMPDMFKRYDAAVVPDIMPLPELLRVATTKAEQTPVPKLNEHQRSWIFDVALRGHDLPKMPKDNVKEFYEKVKTDAFAAKAFQHTVQPGDAAEEACLPARVERWLIANPTKTKSNNKKSKKSESESADGNVSDVEEDAGARVGLLRGFPKAGWRLAIQKVLTNKRGADKTAHQKRDGTSAEKTNVVAPALAMAKVFGIATQTGRDKFREEHRDDIRDLSKMLPGSNAGGKSRKAEAQLWANEDPEEWKAAAATEEGGELGRARKLTLPELAAR